MIVCPLCLTRLDQTSTLHSACLNSESHSRGQPFRITSQRFEDIWCQECLKGNSEPEQLRRETAMWHTGCSCLSPLAALGREGDLSVPEPNAFPTNAQQPTLNAEIYPQIGWMREVYKRRPAGLQNEMFYPQLLFETVNSRLEGGGRAAVSVLLLGEQRSGKSYLATMAVRIPTWQRDASPLDSWNYIYTTPAEGEAAWGPFVDAAVSLSAETVTDNKVLIPTTALKLRHNVRALFLNLADRKEGPAAQRKRNAWLAKAAKPLIRYFENSKPGAATLPGRQRPLRGDSAHRAVVFHDIKGEQARTGFDNQISRRMDECDRIVLLVPATDLSCFRPRILASDTLRSLAGIDESYDAMPTVRRSIASLKPVAKKVVVAVTKLDAVRDITLDAKRYPLWNELQSRRSLHDPEGYSEKGEDELRVLLELLGNNDGEVALKNLISQGRAPAPVFFVWYECKDNEPRAGGITRLVLQGCMQIPL